MDTSVTQRGQTVIPAKIRKRYRIEEGARLVWLDDGKSIKVVPITDDPIKALRGRGKGKKLVSRLLDERKRDRERGEHEGRRE